MKTLLLVLLIKSAIVFHFLVIWNSESIANDACTIIEESTVQEDGAAERTIHAVD